MHCKTIFAVLSISALALAAPVPNDAATSTSMVKTIESLVGSPFGNLNDNGNNNAAGNDNEGNGDNNGNSNWFGNSNNIGSGNDGIKLGSRNDASTTTESVTELISGLVGSPFDNLNSNGQGNSAGNGNKDNGDGNGNGNTFGNSNNIGSGNSGISLVRKSETLGTYVGTIIDDVTVPLNPSSSNTIVASPANNLDNNGGSNTAGSGNTGNGVNNGNNNQFGNNNNIGSNNCGVCDSPITVDPSLTVG